MGVWMDGWMDGRTDPSVVQAQEVQEQVGVVAEQAKKWQLPCQCVWPPGCVALPRTPAHSCGVQADEVASLFTPFLIWKQHSRSQDAFLWGQLQGGGRTTPVTSPFGMWLCLHEMAYPSQDSISPSTLDIPAACLLLSEEPFITR
jgi:hypothetical protein